MSALTIPENAMPVVLILRRDVKRPTAKLVAGPASEPRFEGGKDPIGLHPDSLNNEPIPGEFVIGSLQESYAAVQSFYEWWDCLALGRSKGSG